MNRAMQAAASGMAAEQARLESIAGNLANSNAIGFKGSTLEFGELTDGHRPIGSAPSGTRLVLKQGKLQESGGPFDIAIDGQGFITVQRPSGEIAYTRDGRFTRTRAGLLQNDAGAHLSGIRVPADALKATVEADGRVYVDTPNVKHQSIGRVSIALFAAPDALRSLGGTLFEATAASGRAHYVAPGTAGAGTVAFGMLERSNVSIMDSMMEILSAQRAFEANAKGVQAADEMLRIANNITRG